MPDTTGAIEGTVCDTAGKPIEGADVKADFVDGYLRPPPTTRTDGAGRFRLGDVPAGTYLVRAHKEGLAHGGSRFHVQVPAGGTVEIAAVVLEPAARLALRFAPATPGEPMPAELEWSAHSLRGLTRSVGRIGADGTALLDGVPAGAENIWVRAKGHPAHWIGSPVLAPGETREVAIPLPPSGSVAGTVLDAAGRPLAGAWVQFGALREVESDAAGRFRIDGVPVGSWRIAVYARRLGRGATPEPVAVVAGGTVEAPAITVRPFARLAGRVVAPPDGPLAREAVFELHPRRRVAAIGSIGADGRFALDEVDADVTRLVLAVRGYAPKIVDVPPLASGETAELAPIEVELGGTIRGEVRDAAGNPVEGVWVSVPAWPTLATATDAAGRFTLEGVPAGQVRPEAVKLGTGRSLIGPAVDVAAGGVTEGVAIRLEPGVELRCQFVAPKGGPPPREACDGAPLSFVGPLARIRFCFEGYPAKVLEAPPLVPGEDVQVDLRLVLGGTVRGEVRDAAGNPVEGASVSARRSDGYEPDEEMWPQPSATTDSAGRFCLRGARAGTVKVSAWKQGFVDAGEPPQVAVEADGEVSGVTIALATPPRLVLRIVAPADGPAVREADVSVHPGGGSRRPADPEGRIVVGDLRPGPIESIIVWVEGYPPRVFRDPPLALAAGRDAELTVELELGGAVSGKVTDTAGNPIEGASVAADHAGLLAPEATSDAEGRFRIKRVAPTCGRLSASRKGFQFGEAATPGLVQAGGEVPGIVIRLERCARIVGFVAVPEGGPPVERVLAPFHGSADVDDDGRFVLEGVPAETARIVFEAEGYAPTVVETPGLAPGEEREVWLELELGGTVEGQVVDAAERPLVACLTATRPDGVVLRRTAPLEGGGRFRVRLPAGTVRIRASAHGFKDGEAPARVVVPAGGEVAGVVVTLERAEASAPAG